MRVLFALIVLVMHSAPLWWPRTEEAPQKGPPVPVRITTGEIELLPKEEHDRDPDALRLACPKTYEGIGIDRRWGGLVVKVAKGWPADRAGIRVGDLVEPWDIPRVDGFMTFTVVRDGRRVKMRLKAEQICFRDMPF